MPEILYKNSLATISCDYGLSKEHTHLFESGNIHFEFSRLNLWRLAVTEPKDFRNMLLQTGPDYLKRVLGKDRIVMEGVEGISYQDMAYIFSRARIAELEKSLENCLTDLADPDIH